MNEYKIISWNPNKKDTNISASLYQWTERHKTFKQMSLSMDKKLQTFWQKYQTHKKKTMITCISFCRASVIFCADLLLIISSAAAHSFQHYFCICKWLLFKVTAFFIGACLGKCIVSKCLFDILKKLTLYLNMVINISFTFCVQNIIDCALCFLNFNFWLLKTVLVIA